MNAAEVRTGMIVVSPLWHGPTRFRIVRVEPDVNEVPHAICDEIAEGGWLKRRVLRRRSRMGCRSLYLLAESPVK